MAWRGFMLYSQLQISLLVSIFAFCELPLAKEIEVRKVFVEESLGSDHFPVVSEIWF